MDRKTIRILQLNCARSYEATIDMAESMIEHKIDVALIQEPYTRNGVACGIPPGMKVIGNEGSVKAVIITNSQLDAALVDDCVEECGACAYISGVFGELYVVSVYCQFGDEMAHSLAYIEGVIERANGRTAVFALDANAVSQMWHSKTRTRSRESERRGKELEEYILERGLTIVNEPSEYYTFCTVNGMSDIDVTLTSGSNKFEWSWNIMPEWSISDHNAIYIEGKSRNGVKPVAAGNKWNIKGTDWTEFIRMLCFECHSTDFAEFRGMSIDAKIEWINERMNQVCSKLIRRASAATRKNTWWTHELRVLKREYRDSRRKYQREKAKQGNANINELREQTRRALAAYKKHLRTAKTENWKEFVKTEGNLDPWGAVYKACRGKKGWSEVTSTLRKGDRITNTWRDSVKLLLYEFFPACNHRMAEEVHNIPSEEPNVFTLEEIDKAVSRVKMKSAAGLDGFNPEIILWAWRAIHEYIKEIYDCCLKEGYFPKEWKKAKVCVLLKSAEKPKIRSRII